MPRLTQLAGIQKTSAAQETFVPPTLSLNSGPGPGVNFLEGDNVIQENRRIMGSTDPKNAEEGTLRKLYGISIDKNSVHGSDSQENAKKEIDFFFKN